MHGRGRFCPLPCNTAILKDMDLKFGMLKKFLLSFQNCEEIYANQLNDVIMTSSSQILDLRGIK